MAFCLLDTSRDVSDKILLRVISKQQRQGTRCDVGIGSASLSFIRTTMIRTNEPVLAVAVVAVVLQKMRP